MASAPTESVQALYDRLCESYHAVDDFRMKLLGLLPVATGTGVFLLLSGKAEVIGNNSDGKLSQALGAIGAFGFLFTLGLFTYELSGIKKCHYLIQTGKRLEATLRIRGQFRTRPSYVTGYLNKPFAASIIYPASMAAWLFLALFFTSGGSLGALLAGAVFLLGCGATVFWTRRIGPNEELEDRVLDTVAIRGTISRSELRRELDIDQTLLQRTVHQMQKRGEIVEHDGLLEVADVVVSKT